MSKSRASLAKVVSWLGAMGVMLAAAQRAQAAELRLEGPSDCRDREELRFRVERGLGSSLEAAPQLELEVTIERSGAGYSALLRMREAGARKGADATTAGASERRLGAADCERLMDALSVVIVLAVDRARSADAPAGGEAGPEALPPDGGSAQSAPAAGPDAAPAAAVSGAAPGPAAAPDDEAAPVRANALAWVVGDLGSLPNPGLGVGLGLALDAHRLRLLGAGLWFFEQHSVLEGQGTPAPGADLGLALGLLAACYAPGGSWRADSVLGVCARGEVGRMFGRGTDVRAGRLGGQLWVAPGLHLMGSWRVIHSSLRLTVEGGAVLPLERREFRLGALGGIHRPAAVSLRAGAGLQIVLE